MIKLNVSAANIAVEEKETLTEGRAGLLCQFRFTDEWSGLSKTAVFDGADSRDVILKSDTVAVPAECLSAEGYSLSVGVYGKNSAGDIVIPTVYATVGKIQRSAYPSGKEPAEPTPDVVAQIQQAAANAEALARSVKEDADLGKFNGKNGTDGGWYTPEVTQPDANTMRMSFTPSKEGMPAVEPTEITLPKGSSEGGSVSVDDTLTVQGAAADAKATGDAISKLSDEIADIPAGNDGVGIESVEQTTTSTEDGGTNVITVTKTDGTSSTFQVKNGSKGDKGDTGYTGPAGEKGDKGDTGAAGSDGKSAYAYAQEGGYTGTETEFAAKLAAEKFANPNALTFTGAVAGSYDGSATLSVKIPSAVTDEHINSLIDTKLGVIENGAY